MLTCVLPQRRAFTSRSHPLTEDSLLFDGLRATYGRFRVLHQIGAGGLGPVFRGEDLETGRAVAIKVLRAGLTPERVALAASALASIKDRLTAHPALATILETGVHDVEPYVVSDFADGDSLDVALRDFGPADVRDALPRLRWLADALDMAAALGVHHGGLHLRDIVVSPEITVLTGIGLAPVLERVGVRPPVRRPYTSPEVAAGEPCGAAADQYSLAAIAHEWMSGRRILGPDGEGVHVSAPSAAASDAIAAVFRRALSASPEGRFPSASAFAAALGEVADDGPPRPKVSRRRPAPPPAPRLAFDDDALTANPSSSPHASAGSARLPQGAAVVDDVVATLEAGAASDGERLDSLEADASVSPGHHGMEVVADQFDGDEAGAPASSDEEAFTTLSGSGSTSWWVWAGAGVAMAVLMALGGWALLRWGTPSLSRPAEEQAQSQSRLPDVVTLPALEAPQGASSSSAPGSAVAVQASRPREAARPPSDIPAGLRQAPVAPAARARTTAPRATATPPKASQARGSSPTPAAPLSAAARRKAEPGPPKAAGLPGRVLVRTTPSGAEVFVNGTRRGVSPLALRDLALGAYVIRASRPGSATREERITLDVGRPSRALELTLGPAPTGPTTTGGGLGSLVVESRPSGARVWVDGRDAGVTPLTVQELAAGEHAVRVQRSGFLPIATTALVTPGRRARLGVSLTSERPR